MMEVTGLAGVMISTSPERFPAMESFYLSVLGDHLRSRRAGFVNFEWCGARLTITIHDALTGTNAEPARVMVNLAVADAETAAAQMAAMGAILIRPPEEEAWGGRIATFADPDGNYLQFLELPPV